MKNSTKKTRFQNAVLSILGVYIEGGGGPGGFLAIFGVPGGAPLEGGFSGFSGFSGPSGWGGVGSEWGGVGLGWGGIGLGWGGVGSEWGGIGPR